MSNIIASLSVLGTTCKRPEDNAARCELIVQALEALSPDTHALILPGGMFFHDKTLAPLSPQERCDALQNTAWVQAFSCAAQNMTIVTGLDIAAEDEPLGQYSVAINNTGATTVSRKVFPTKGEVARGLNIQAQDFVDPSRFTHARQTPLIMHTCYDIFGSIDARSGKTVPTRLSHVPQPLDSNKKDCYARYCELMNSFEVQSHHSPIIAVNIHDFARPGRDIFYQRHGIASASAAFNGAIVIGAAHFSDELPTRTDQSPLAAKNVPHSHLTARFHRQAHALNAQKARTLEFGPFKAILRTFKI